MRAEEVITTHGNTDFDAFASMLAARRLYPNAVIALAGSLNRNVRDFYRLHAEELGAIVEAARLEFDAIRRTASTQPKRFLWRGLDPGALCAPSRISNAPIAVRCQSFLSKILASFGPEIGALQAPFRPIGGLDRRPSRGLSIGSLTGEEPWRPRSKLKRTK